MNKLNSYKRKKLIVLLTSLAADAAIIYGASAANNNVKEEYRENAECLAEIQNSIDSYDIDASTDVIYLKAQNEKNLKSKQNMIYLSSGLAFFLSGAYCGVADKAIEKYNKEKENQEQEQLTLSKK